MKEMIEKFLYIQKRHGKYAKTVAFSPFFRKGRLYELPFNVIHAREKFKNPASKDNPPCKNQIVNLVILV